MAVADDARAASPSLVRRLVPLAILVAGLALALAFDLDERLSFDALRDQRAELTALAAGRPILAALGFVVAYALVVAFSIPGASLMTIAGGFLFGTWLGGAYSIVGATIGATAVFAAARYAAGDALPRRAGPRLARLRDGFRKDAFQYLLVLRLVPIFPFWLVNLAPAAFGVPMRTYVVATVLGILPGSFVYAGVGAGLGAVFDAGGEPDLGLILEPEILLPLIGLAVLALIPVLYKRLRRRR